MRKKLFAFDIDGTLLDHVNKEVPASAIKTVRELRKQGHIVGIATGRNKSQMLKVLDPKDFDFLILCNGGYLEIDGKQVFDFKFTEQEKEKVIQLVEENNLEYGCTNEDHLFAINPFSDNVQTVIEAFGVMTPEKEKNLQKLNIYQFMVYEAEKYTKVLKELEEDFIFHRYPFEFGFDIVKKDVNKGEMLKEVVKLFHIDIKDTVAFGDADNDTQFLKIAGLGIAIGNGSEAAKQSADYITKASNEDGILYAVQKFGFIER